MRKSGVNRVVAVVAAVLVATGAAMVTAGAAWSAPRSHPVQPKIRSTHSVLRFDDAAGLVELTIPTPPCPVTNEDCEWMLLINEPTVPGAPIVGTVTGRSGVLALTFPNFCGVIQADSLIGPAPWMRTHGVRRRINTCVTPTTTTTTKPEVISTTTTTKPRAVSAASTTPTTSALPFTMATSASPTTTPVHVTATTAAAQLPFTGLDLKPLVLLGSTLILIGGMLLTTVESRRRALQRAAALRLDDVREGTRKASSWFLGL